VRSLHETDLARPEYIIECENLVKIYKTKDIEVLALQGLELTVEHGEMTAIIGNSGSGKSTFLNMIGGLDRPNAGRLYVDGKNLFKMTERELVAYKRETVGFVWQNNARNLLPWLPAWQNVQTPMLFLSGQERKARAMELLDLVGLRRKAHSRLSELSGGEQQRVAIAIALANNPRLLLADEPTGSVDTKTAGYIFDIFRRLNSENGLSILIVTHDRALSKRVSRVVAIRDGKTASEMILPRDLRARIGETGGFAGEETEETDAQQEEFAVLDRAGRVQISRALLDQAGVSGRRVRMRAEDERIIIERE
jgi:ABC-type lipoprotein export system ATPase subunit